MKKLFINLPVEDLNKSKAFYQALGCQHKANFSNDYAQCMIFDEKVLVMLHTKESFSKGTNKTAVLGGENLEMMLDILLDSRSEVDEVFNKAIAAGAVEGRKHPESEMMYCKSFADLDGHLWEACWMDDKMF